MKKVLLIITVFFILIIGCTTTNELSQVNMKNSENNGVYSNLTGETIFIFTQEEGADEILKNVIILKPDTNWVSIPIESYNSNGFGNNLFMNIRGDDDPDFYLPFHDPDPRSRVDGLYGTMNGSMRFGNFKTENIDEMIIRLPEILHLYNDTIMEFSIIENEVEINESRYWYSDSTQVELIILDSRIIAKNISTLEEKILLEYEADWTSFDNGGFKLTINFIDKTEGVIERFNFFTHFAEKRNHEFGGGTGRTLDTRSGDMSIYFEDLEPKYPVETFILKEIQIQFNDKKIISYPFDLDKRL